MLFRMNGLVKRGGVWICRREVPPRLRSIIGSREVKRSLATPDQQTAQRRWQAVTAEVDRLFAEAEAALKNPSIAAYKAIEEWKQDRAARPVEQHEEEALDSHLTTLLERNNLDQHQRAGALLALDLHGDSLTVRSDHLTGLQTALRPTTVAYTSVAPGRISLPKKSNGIEGDP